MPLKKWIFNLYVNFLSYPLTLDLSQKAEKRLSYPLKPVSRCLLVLEDLETEKTYKNFLL